MKIAAKSIDSFIKSPQKSSLGEFNAALIYGVDSGQVRERSGKIANAILGKAADDNFAKLELAESELLSDPSRLCDELSAISMMSPQRVIIIRDASDKSTKIIEEAAAFFHKDNFLLITSDELSAKSSLRALFEKRADCAALACYKDEIRDIGGIIRQKLDEAGISYSREIVDYLTGQLGNDRYVTYSELDKLILFAGDDKKISLDDAKSLIDYNKDAELDDLVNSALDKNLIVLEKNLTRHIREGTQPILYLRALQRYFNRLYEIRAKMEENGQDAESIIMSLRPPVFFKQQPILIRHANNWNIANIVKALKLLVSAELSCKSSDIPAIPASSRKLMQLTQLR